MSTEFDIHKKRAEANQLPVSLQIGKHGITDATIAELQGQLKKNHLVKVRLLRSATHESGDQEQAERLAEATGATLVDVRGHTAVYWKG